MTTPTQPAPTLPAGRTKPEIAKPEGQPPADLVSTDLEVGTGAEAVPGTLTTVHYVGVAFASGAEFDASWTRNEPFPFLLGEGQVIEGWDRGVVGMKVGGRRQLVIPPDLAYGDRGAGDRIGPGETLIFVIDLLDVSEDPVLDEE
ncbi:MAG: FKBP-type peptidyl-prolyl cis-trans isomerase [Acidimicrobiales bacterium]